MITLITTNNVWALRVELVECNDTGAQIRTTLLTDALEDLSLLDDLSDLEIKRLLEALESTFSDLASNARCLLAGWTV